MRIAMQYVGAVWATVKRDALIFASYRLRSLSQVIGMLFTLTMFYYVSKLVRAGAVGSAAHYYAFAVVGIVIMGILTAALSTSQVIRMELMQGNFERIMISPLGPVGGVIAVVTFPIIYSTAFAAVMLALAVAIFRFPLHLAGVPLAIGVDAVGTAAFVCIGLLFVAGLLAYKSSMGATWVVASLSLLGGAYFPVRLFPAWLRWTSEVQPFAPTVDLLRHLLIGTQTTQPAWLELVRLAGFTALLMPLSAAILSLAVRASRRRGTILEF